LIADVMQRKFALKEGEVAFGYEGNVGTLVKSIAFKDIYSLADCRNSYYQQRWHSTETDEVPTIEDILKEDAGSEDYHKVLSLFGIEELLPKKLIFLSSGELRKFLIVRTLLKHPRVLILDNPFIGLDAPSRGVLVEMLQQITKLKCVQVVLLLSNPDDIPEMIYTCLTGQATQMSSCLQPRGIPEANGSDSRFIPIRRKGRFRSERGVFTSGRGTERTFRSSRYFQDGTCFDQVW